MEELGEAGYSNFLGNVLILFEAKHGAAILTRADCMVNVGQETK